MGLRQKFIDGVIRGWKAGGGPLPTGMTELPSRSQRKAAAQLKPVEDSLAGLVAAAPDVMTTAQLKELLSKGVKVRNGKGK